MAMKGLIASIYISIQVESNWTKKFLYLLYLFFAPLSSILIVCIIYGFLGQGFNSPSFYFALFGSLSYFILADTFFNTAYTVIDDREHYRVLKYLIVSKTHYIVYLLGRGIGKFALSFVGITLNLLWIFPVFNIDTHFSLILFVISIGVGFVGAFGLALLFSSYYLLAIREETSLLDVLFGGLYLISGAMFSPTVLPGILSKIASYFPISTAIEMTRFSIFGSHLTPYFQGTPFSQFMFIFIVSNIISLLVGLVMFEIALSSAIKKGYIDVTTAF